MKGSKSFIPNSSSNYICSRSGEFTSSSEWERQLKSQGSKKIGYHCTAQIIVKMCENSVSVMYYKNHYKHDIVPEHIPIADEIKETIAGNLFFHDLYFLLTFSLL